MHLTAAKYGFWIALAVCKVVLERMTVFADPGFRNSVSILVLCGALIGFAASAARAQGGAKRLSGELEFREYCAQCHGIDGTGDGPVAPALRQQPANLTLLAKNNGGVFPAKQVRDFIYGTRTVASHGPREMPIWGYAFMFRQGALAGPFVPVLTPSEVDTRIDLLVGYLKSIQRE